MGEWRYSFTILYLGTVWKWVISFTPRLLYLRGSSSRYPFIGGWWACWRIEIIPERTHARTNTHKQVFSSGVRMFWSQCRLLPPLLFCVGLSDPCVMTLMLVWSRRMLFCMFCLLVLINFILLFFNAFGTEQYSRIWLQLNAVLHVLSLATVCIHPRKFMLPVTIHNRKHMNTLNTPLL
jgi:hypothetical protein